MKKASAFAVIEKDFNASDSMRELNEVLSPFFPAYELGDNGHNYFAPDDVKDLDKLFARFGLEFNSQDDRFDNLEYLTGLWRRLIIVFGTYIGIHNTMPKTYLSQMKKTPPHFKDYIDAVIANNLEVARALAKKLDVENLEAALPTDACA